MLQRQWYRMLDSKPAGVMAIDEDDADRWNRQGFGVFWSVNEFNGARRIENLAKINAWAVDMDEGTKSEQRDRILRSPLVPSMIVETKRGFQVYWNAKDGRGENWNAIVLDRLVPFFGADKNARDLARILRVPGYLHLKDPANPFRVRLVNEHRVSYTQQQIGRAFPDCGSERRAKLEPTRIRKEQAVPSAGEGFWDAVARLDCEEGLARLSGHPACGGEQFTFRRNANGGKNILVDGKGSSAWIDKNGKIGSLSEGGPTIAQWLRWYGNSYGEAAKVIKHLFPQLASL